MSETIYRQAPYIEQRSEQLLGSVFGDPNATRQQGETVRLHRPLGSAARDAFRGERGAGAEGEDPAQSGQVL